MSEHNGSRPSVDLDALTKPFPASAIKQRALKKGPNPPMASYVEGHTVIHRLNAATGNNWNFHITRLEREGDLLMATGELEIPGHGVRTGMGVQKIHERGGEDLAKGVITDALKKAATLFGVGLELYGPDYDDSEAEPPRQRRGSGTPSQQNRTRSQPSSGQPDRSRMRGQEATQPQFNKLWAEANERGWHKDQVYGRAGEINPDVFAGEERTLKVLDKAQMSELIEAVIREQPWVDPRQRPLNVDPATGEILDEQPQSQNGTLPQPSSEAQRKAINNLADELGMEKAALIDFVRNLVGDDIESSAQLSYADASTVIQELQALKGAKA